MTHGSFLEGSPTRPFSRIKKRKKVGYSKATFPRGAEELTTRDGNTTGMARHLQAKHSQDWQLYCQQRLEKKVARAARKALSSGTKVSDDTYLF